MNILLVYPEMPETHFQFKSLIKLSGKSNTFAPVGLLTVASLLPSDWNKKLVDINVNPLTDDDVLWADLVMISAMSVHVAFIKDITDKCKRLGRTTVAGGPLFAHEHEKFPEIDHFVLNEAELTLQPFIDDYLAGKPKRIYKSAQFADMHKSPAPMWELLKQSDYAYAEVQYSRGCPYMCDFCDVTNLFGRRPRTKTVKQVITELDVLMARGAEENIFFADDNLIGNKRLLKDELLPALIEWRDKNKYAPSFSTQLTINLADDEELMQMLLEAGFRQVFIGVESVDQATLEAMRKKQNMKRNILEDLKKIQRKGFFAFTGYIVGLDTDTENVFDEQADFIQASAVPLVTTNILKAPPGTELYDRLKRENRLTGDYFFDLNRSNVIPLMNPEKLTEGYKHLLERIHSPENSYKRIREYFKLERKSKVRNSIKRKFKLKDLLTVFRIVFSLGVKSSSRSLFWSLMWHLFRTEKHNIDVGVMFAGFAEHNHKNYRDYKADIEKGETIIGKKQLAA